MIDSIEKEIFDDLDCFSCGSLLITVVLAGDFVFNKFVILIDCGNDDNDEVG